jgi:hypothetical protein
MKCFFPIAKVIVAILRARVRRATVGLNAMKVLRSERRSVVLDVWLARF